MYLWIHVVHDILFNSLLKLQDIYYLPLSLKYDKVNTLFLFPEVLLILDNSVNLSVKIVSDIFLISITHLVASVAVSGMSTINSICLLWVMYVSLWGSSAAAVLIIPNIWRYILFSLVALVRISINTSSCWCWIRSSNICIEQGSSNWHSVHIILMYSVHCLLIIWLLMFRLLPAVL